MAGDGQAKGTVLVHLRAHVTDRGGEGAWKSLVQRLPAGDRAILDSLLVSGAWYPVGLWNRALREHLVAHAADPGAEVFAIAQRIAATDMHAVFKILLKIASPETVVRRAGWLWDRYFDRGTITPVEHAPSEWHVRLEAPTGEDDGAGEATCAYGAPGWLTQALHQVGAKHASVAHVRCRFAFAKACEYRVTW
jgi:hypothetical protein